MTQMYVHQKLSYLQCIPLKKTIPKSRYSLVCIERGRNVQAERLTSAPPGINFSSLPSEFYLRSNKKASRY